MFLIRAGTRVNVKVCTGANHNFQRSYQVCVMMLVVVKLNRID